MRAGDSAMALAVEEDVAAATVCSRACVCVCGGVIICAA